MRKVSAIVAAALIGLSAPLSAQEATPNHVYQVTDQILQELKALNSENFSKAGAVKLSNDPTSPRHVLFLVRDQWRKVQLLRFMNGLNSNSLAPATVHEVRPQEVKDYVNKMLVEVQALRSAYGLPPSDIKAPLPSGKKPVDVYANLMRISAELDALGVPATVPNDVYRVAASISQNLETLASAKGVDVSSYTAPASTGRTPRDAYTAALELIGAMQTLAEMDQTYQVKGGLSVPVAADGPKSPADVILVLSRALADTMAMMNSADVGNTVATAPYEGGKTPSDVYNTITYARLLVEAMAS